MKYFQFIHFKTKDVLFDMYTHAYTKRLQYIIIKMCKMKIKGCYCRYTECEVYQFRVKAFWQIEMWHRYRYH